VAERAAGGDAQLAPVRLWRAVSLSLNVCTSATDKNLVKESVFLECTPGVATQLSSHQPPWQLSMPTHCSGVRCCSCVHEWNIPFLSSRFSPHDAAGPADLSLSKPDRLLAWDLRHEAGPCSAALPGSELRGGIGHRQGCLCHLQSGSHPPLSGDACRAAQAAAGAVHARRAQLARQGRQHLRQQRPRQACNWL